MADNIDIKDAAEATKAVATDDAGADGHVQLFKLAISANGVATLIPGDVANGLDVDVTRLPDATVVGKAAHDAAASGNPLLLGGRAYATAPTAVDADGDAVDLWLDRNGRIVTKTRPTGKTFVNYKAAYSASQTGATVYTPTTGKLLCCTHIVISASATGSVYLFDNSDSAGNAWSPTLTLAAYGGWEAHFSDENPLVMSAVNNLLKFTSGVGAAGSIWLHGWEES